MDIKRIDHYSIRTLDVEKTRRFYTDVIGFRVGPRPPFDFPGLWLFNGEPPKELKNDGNYGILHVIGVDPDNLQGLIDYLGEVDLEQLKGGSGSLDHIAFSATGRDAMAERCRKADTGFFERTVPALGLHQMFIKDPNGVTLEFNYPASEAPGRTAAQP
jgi:catechol 2,3-dioxygenase-like lactoylglutathione lyase family enzyme